MFFVRCVILVFISINAVYTKMYLVETESDELKGTDYFNSKGFEKGGSECEFTRDCSKVDKCRIVTNKRCVCKFGSCVRDGGNLGLFDFKPECKDYLDCACKDSPETCFCRNGRCNSADKFECHESSDCSKMAKCKGKSCGCRYNLCEIECNTVDDCNKGHFGCRGIGVKCKCEESLCERDYLPRECDLSSVGHRRGRDHHKYIQECVKIGKCSADKPCNCQTGQCVEPWNGVRCDTNYYCTRYIAQCMPDKCTCENKVQDQKEGGDHYGECVLKGIVF